MSVIEVKCKVCGKLLKVQAGEGHEAAAPEVLDYFANIVTCGPCLEAAGFGERKKRKADPVQKTLPIESDSGGQPYRDD